jgi:hypothetical protein
MASNVAVVISAGNGGNATKIDYPACIPQAIAVGATEDRYSMREVSGWVYPIMSMSNNGADLDLYTYGKYTTTDISDKKSLSLGTSNATVAFATYLTKRLSAGENLSTIMASVNASLVNAYKTTTLFYPKQFNLTND